MNNPASLLLSSEPIEKISKGARQAPGGHQQGRGCSSETLAHQVLPGGSPPLPLPLACCSRCNKYLNVMLPPKTGPVQWLGSDCPVCRVPEGF